MRRKARQWRRRQSDPAFALRLARLLRASLKTHMPRKMTRAAAAEFFRRLSAAAPSPTTELVYHDPFTLLVAVALSAQATDISVNRATGPLFKVADTPAKMLALGEEALGDYIRTIGLWRTKARNVIALCKRLVDEFDGVVPAERAALESLPGVGRKTANVVCNVAFGQPTMAVDTHIFRVGNRTGLAPGKTPLDVELGLLKITPPEFLRDAHNWLILHGRYTCKARAPACPGCLVNDLCLFREKAVEEPPLTSQAQKPKASKSPAAKPRSGEAAVRTGAGRKAVTAARKSTKAKRAKPAAKPAGR